MAIVNAACVEPDPWGNGCTAWRLLQGKDLAVAEEEMPPGTSERRHIHSRARQLFYVLSGRLTMELDGGSYELGAGDALEIEPGRPHRAGNASRGPVRFLVISAPTTAGDRINLD